jgi:hypothetical protein
MRSRGSAILLLTALLAAAACDRTPVDPLDDPAIAALTGTEGQGPSSLTLPGLLYSAIRTVHADHGMDAARDIVRDLARIQHRLDAAPVSARPALRRELRAEQLRIVLLVNGGDVVAQTIHGVSEEAARLSARRDMLAGSGIDAPEATAILQDLPILLARARTASTDIEALDAATRAAARTDRMHGALAGAARLPSLTDLYEDAAARLRHRPRHDLVAESAELRAAADEALLRSHARDHAQEAAKAARDAQIRVVLEALGPDVVADVIGWGQHRVREQEQKLGAESVGRDVSRLERMNASAGDMLDRADLQLRRGNSAAALDLAAHAVDLLNALEATLTSN